MKRQLIYSMLTFLLFHLCVACNKTYEWSEKEEEALELLDDLTDDYSEVKEYQQLGVSRETLEAYKDHTLPPPLGFVQKVETLDQLLIYKENEAERQRMESFLQTSTGMMYGFVYTWQGLLTLLGIYIGFIMISLLSKRSLEKSVTCDFNQTCDVEDWSESLFTSLYPILVILVYLVCFIVRFFSV
ncbi:hypothetical protein K5X82_03275 [Halosquirtibacter xylanolyticus]|uniref:hypothetical protein n=1 Tax=Halosquirtibacter xylanolyticus TaxID=3374599 RepID=UPI0037481448|nr:hypothetical protein K5X82_03275 [Prolixibacteraceae bacterium]